MSRLELVAELMESLRTADAARRAALLSDAPEDVRAEALSLLPLEDEAERRLGSIHWEISAPAEEPPEALPEGTRVGPYTTIEPIGQGGMGVVYRAQQDEPRRDVALKLLSGAMLSAGARQRFRREAAALARLQHPGIARVIDAGAAPAPDGPGHLHYIAMELIEGAPITRYVREAALPIAGVLELLASVCDAVEHAHRKGVIHRDLKPSNILVDASGSPRLLDFGVARLLEADPDLGATEGAGPVVGTLAYMSPEQAAGEDIDTRSDCYALGVVAYEVLTGRLPHERVPRSVLDAARMLADGGAARPRVARPEISVDLEAVLLKALEREPARRYQSAAGLADDLRRIVRREPVSARRPTAAYLVLSYARRRRGVVAMSAAAACAALAGGGVAAWQFAHAVSAERQATQRLDETYSLVLSLLGDVDAAIAELPGSTTARGVLSRSALGHVDSLAAGVTSPQQLGELAEAYRSLAVRMGSSIYPSAGDHASGAELADAALRLAIRLVELEPSARSWDILAHAHFSRVSFVATVEERLACIDEAVECGRRAVETGRGTVTEEKLRADTIDLVHYLTSAIEVCDDPARVLVYANEAISIQRALSAQYPLDVGVTISLGTLLGTTGRALEQAQPSRAVEFARWAVDVFAECSLEPATQDSVLRHKALSQYLLARVLARQGSAAEALAAADSGAAGVEALYRSDPANSFVRQDYIAALHARAQVRAIAAGAGGDAADALRRDAEALFDEAIREAEAFSTDYPGSPRSAGLVEWLRAEKAAADPPTPESDSSASRD